MYGSKLGVSDQLLVNPGITLRSCCFEWDTQIEYTLASHDERCVSTRLELLFGRKTKIEEVAGT